VEAGVLIVIPARNEAATIGEVVGKLRQAGPFAILVVNDCSTDLTAARAAEAGAVMLSPVLPLGAWGAIQTGLRYAEKRGFDCVVTLDADGQHESRFVPDLLEKIRSGEADVVIGAYPERGSPARRLAWAFFRKLTGFKFADLTSGFRAYNRRAIELLSDEEATLFDYQDVGVLLLLRQAGLRIVEVPVFMQLRANGISRVFCSWWAVFRYLLETGVLCLAHWGERKRASE
jgi:glycosyltransferase involved in cell wall biosynthesis